MGGDQKSSAQISCNRHLLKQGSSGPAALGWPLYASLCLSFGRNSEEFRLQRNSVLLRSHPRDQQKNNKRAGERPAPPCHSAQLAGLHCRFSACFPVPAFLLCGRLPHTAIGCWSSAAFRGFRMHSAFGSTSASADGTSRRASSPSPAPTQEVMQTDGGFAITASLFHHLLRSARSRCATANRRGTAATRRRRIVRGATRLGHKVAVVTAPREHLVRQSGAIAVSPYGCLVPAPGACVASPSC